MGCRIVGWNCWPLQPSELGTCGSIVGYLAQDETNQRKVGMQDSRFNNRAPWFRKYDFFTTTAMYFFSFPTEIRLKIYSDLLVRSELIVFVADYGPPSPRLFRSKRDGLCPALLRVNKKAHGEAIPLLYSKNRFQFPDILTWTPSTTDSAHIAPFLSKIGSQASLLRHVCISFPISSDYQRSRDRLHEAHIKNLELIRDTCTSITTLDLSLDSLKNGFLLDYMGFKLDGSPIAAEALDLLDTRFKAIPSLQQQLVVNITVYGEQDLNEDLLTKMRKCGWSFKAIRLEMPKKTWICDEHGVEFDNEEDYNAYMSHLDLEREREEEERWTEEYYRRRRDPYWKNDSDYD